LPENIFPTVAHTSCALRVPKTSFCYSGGSDHFTHEHFIIWRHIEPTIRKQTNSYAHATLVKRDNLSKILYNFTITAKLETSANNKKVTLMNKATYLWVLNKCT